MRLLTCSINRLKLCFKNLENFHKTSRSLTCVKSKTIFTYLQLPKLNVCTHHISTQDGIVGDVNKKVDNDDNDTGEDNTKR